MPEVSRYDEIHDSYSALLSSKAGTRYERLAALVFQSLNDEHAVIHDLRLIGSSKVKHQIDVTIEREGGQRRVLLECKDFDVSGRKVGLGIIRDFFGVVEDVKPDEAIVLTCTGFTRDAQQYARAKGIKLAVMRAFEEKDWEGRIKTVVVNIHVQVPPTIDSATIDLGGTNPEAVAAGIMPGGNPVLSDSLTMVGAFERLPFPDLLNRLATEARSASGQDKVEVEFDPDAWRLEVNGSTPVPFSRFAVGVTFRPPMLIENTIENDRIAELILQGLSEQDAVIFADQLAGRTIGEGGQVTTRPGGSG